MPYAFVSDSVPLCMRVVCVAAPGGVGPCCHNVQLHTLGLLLQDCLHAAKLFSLMMRCW